MTSDKQSEQQKYRAYTYNIAGFALITPFGRLILDPITTAQIFEKFGPLIFAGYIFLCILFAMAGFKSISIGRDIFDT